jgi:tetratricopeptide (TPR) repeat protein
MAKFTSAEVRKVAERLRRARDRDHPAHFLIGAGCSITAGIPSAAELIQRIHADYAAQCADLDRDNLHSYGACMALLTVNERRDLIRPYLKKAKINWGTIALAQLIVKGFVDRVLTVNFDLVLENACGLLGLQPAVYDFGVAPAGDLSMIVSPSIVHMHGRSYGLVLLNTDQETQRHKEKLRPILTASLRNAPLVVVGYSGSADGIFQTLFEEFEGLEPLYWAGYEEEAKPHIRPFMEKKHFQFIGGADFDRFMIELAQSLGCWPPNLFANPLGHLLEELSPVVDYPVTGSDTSIDLLGELRRKLESWQKKLGESSLQELFMKGRFEDAAKVFLGRSDRDTAPDEDREAAVWSFIMWANHLRNQAKKTSGDEAARLFGEAGEKYRIALTVLPFKYEVLNNWGNLLFEQATRSSNEQAQHLFESATEEYQTAIEVKPDRHGAFGNFGVLLIEQGKRASKGEAEQFFVKANEMLSAAAKIDPTATYNLACLAAVTGNEAECRLNLELAEQNEALPSIEHLVADPDLRSVRDKEWFVNLVERQKEGMPKRDPSRIRYSIPSPLPAEPTDENL